MSINRPALRGLTAVVADGARGIGREVALNLGACGARVGVVSGSRARADKTSRAIEEAGGVAWPFPADLSDPAAVPGLVSRVGWRLGSADILISCAFAAPPEGPAGAGGVAELARAMISAVLPGMLDRGWGRIVTVLGEPAAVPLPAASDQDPVAPALAEGALSALNALAAGLAGTGVTANAYRSWLVTSPAAPGSGEAASLARDAALMVSRIPGQHNGMVWDLAGGGPDPAPGPAGWLAGRP